MGLPVGCCAAADELSAKSMAQRARRMTFLLMGLLHRESKQKAMAKRNQLGQELTINVLPNRTRPARIAQLLFHCSPILSTSVRRL